MKKYSAFSLLRNALGYNRHWQRAWRSPEPKRKYDVVIVGGGGHGLATAYYLAKEHGVRHIAVLEKAWRVVTHVHAIYTPGVKRVCPGA